MRRFCCAVTLAFCVMAGTVYNAIAQSSVALPAARITAMQPIQPSRPSTPLILRRTQTRTFPIPDIRQAPPPWLKMPSRSVTGAARTEAAPSGKAWPQL